MKLESDDQFTQYNHIVQATSKAHMTNFAIDLSKDPLEACQSEAIYANAQANLYLMFSVTLRTPKGIEFVRDNEDDARAVYTSLLNYYTGKSTHAKMSAKKHY